MTILEGFRNSFNNETKRKSKRKGMTIFSKRYDDLKC